MFYYTILKRHRLTMKLSEAELAQRAGISRLTLRAIESGKGNPTWDSVFAYAKALGMKLELMFTCPESNLQSEDSVVGISCLILQNGFDSWPGYLMNFVDAYRRTSDARLIALGPVSDAPIKLKALLASTVLALCEETGTTSPAWVLKNYFLSIPWFPSGMENLKAMALLESPVYFRRNNIFVLENFLKRS